MTHVFTFVVVFVYQYFLPSPHEFFLLWRCPNNNTRHPQQQDHRFGQWIAPPRTKSPDYYNSLKEQYKKIISVTEFLPLPSLLATMVLLTTDKKSRKLIGVDKEAMEEARKCLNIRAKVLDRRSNVMWYVMLATEDTSNLLAATRSQQCM